MNLKWIIIDSNYNGNRKIIKKPSATYVSIYWNFKTMLNNTERILFKSHSATMHAKHKIVGCLTKIKKGNYFLHKFVLKVST